jgi:hypothetical protein
LYYQDARKTYIQWTGKVAVVKVPELSVCIKGRNDGNEIEVSGVDTRHMSLVLHVVNTNIFVLLRSMFGV